MKYLLLLSLIVQCLSVKAQNLDTNEVVKVQDGLHFMFYEGSNSKSTIIEFRDFIALIEVPVIDEGGGAQNLRDDIAGGDKVLRTLRKKFPHKPLRYVLHSHWHPHSISSVTPFLEQGVTLISTSRNYEKLQTFVDAKVLHQYKKHIQLMDKDSLVINDQTNKIVIHRFEQKDFPNTPTGDYLYFHLPRYDALQCGCMYNRWTGEPVAGKEVRTGREEDLHKFMQSRNLHPDFLVRLSKDDSYPNHIIGYEVFKNVIENGISARELYARYVAIDESVLRDQQDSLLIEVIENNIPAAIFNNGVYDCLRTNNLSKALLLAQYQAMINPSDANAWDTLGEVYYFLGNQKLANSYNAHCRKINPAFQGGEQQWKKDLDEYSKNWK